VVLYLSVYRKLEGRYRVPALLIALAPTFAANTQVITGFLQTPHNIEQNFGVIAVATLCAVVLHAIGHRPWMLIGAAAASCVLLAIYSSHVFVVNASVLQRTRLSSQLLDELRTEPESGVFDN